MNKSPFHDEITLAEEAEKLGKQALKLGIISTFSVRHYRDSKQFFIPAKNSFQTEQEAEPFTPERAYLHFKKLVSQASIS